MLEKTPGGFDLDTKIFLKSKVLAIPMTSFASWRHYDSSRVFALSILDRRGSPTFQRLTNIRTPDGLPGGTKMMNLPHLSNRAEHVTL